MTHGGVPLYGDGEGEVDGAGETDVGQREEVGDRVEEQPGLLDGGDYLWQAEHDHGHHQVHQVKAHKTQQQQVKVLLELLAHEQDDGEAVSNNSQTSDENLKNIISSVSAISIGDDQL